ncbi:hypothetical protein ACWGOQ_0016560 [Aquimarina sp. M1]
MSYSDIRNSLHYWNYIEHSRSLKLAADENLKLFDLSNQEPSSERNETKGVGLLNSTMLLYAVSVEIIFKARALFEVKDNILNGEIENFKQFMNIWKGNTNGHDFFRIKEHYGIEVSEDYLKVFNELLSFTSWAGRFPYPRGENDIVHFESGNARRGSLGMDYDIKINEFIEEQIKIMTE